MKRELTSSIYEQMKNRKVNQDQKTGENPTKILKLRYVKGEISKDASAC